MKKQSIIVFALLIISLFSFNIVSAQIDNSIVGSWSFHNMDFSNESDPNPVLSENELKIMNELSHLSFDFKEDGSVRLTVFDDSSSTKERTMGGTYKVNDTLLIMTIDGNDQTMRVKDINTDEIKLSGDSDQADVMVFHRK